MTKLGKRFLAELKGVGRLGLIIFKSLFWPETCIYSCPDCNQTITLHQICCDRCWCPIDW